MLNNRPIAQGKYHQGLYIPKNRNKVIKLNNEGGLYYRSGLEKKMMIYLDHKQDIINWAAEYVVIPYKLKTWNQKLKETEITDHRYHIDFYYEQLLPDGVVKRVLVEVKPFLEVMAPIKPAKTTAKTLKNYEYAVKMYNKNLSKWEQAIQYAEVKGMEFIILTEQIINKLIKS